MINLLVITGRTVYKSRERRDTVTDFSFTMPLQSEPSSEAALRLMHVVNDGEVVSRGHRLRERADWTSGKDIRLLNRAVEDSRWPVSSVGTPPVRVSWKERRAADRVAMEIRRHGLPPFIRRSRSAE